MKTKKKSGENAGEIKLKTFKQAAIKLVEETVVQFADLRDSMDIVARELKRLSETGQ